MQCLICNKVQIRRYELLRAHKASKKLWLKYIDPLKPNHLEPSQLESKPFRAKPCLKKLEVQMQYQQWFHCKTSNSKSQIYFYHFYRIKSKKKGTTVTSRLFKLTSAVWMMYLEVKVQQTRFDECVQKLKCRNKGMCQQLRSQKCNNNLQLTCQEL